MLEEKQEKNIIDQLYELSDDEIFLFLKSVCIVAEKDIIVTILDKGSIERIDGDPPHITIRYLSNRVYVKSNGIIYENFNSGVTLLLSSPFITYDPIKVRQVIREIVINKLL